MFIWDSRRSYRAYSYAGLILITDLFSVGTPVGVTELILIQNLYLYGLMFIQDSRRSYSTYSYTVVLVSTTKLILVLRILYLYYEVYPGLMELILVFQIREYP